MGSLLKEVEWGDHNANADANGDGCSSSSRRHVLPVEWVVDVVDKDNDWFVATAYGYNDAEQKLHVMVPDRHAPTWTGDVTVNPLVRGTHILYFAQCPSPPPRTYECTVPRR